MDEITEGKATVRIGNGVFFNPKMRGLRDMSVAFLKAAEKRDARLLDSTAATGIRGLRYSLEARIKDIKFLDINKSASDIAKKNVKDNGLDSEVLNLSIQEFANTNRESFDIIDLDPFGSPAPCMYDIMKLARNGTILMATATDTAVLCGAHPTACVKTYGSKPLHSELCKEAGLRILLSFSLRTAAQFNMGIEPLLSISDMHYMRIFIRLKAGAASAKASFKEVGFGTFCRKCKGFSYVKGIAPVLNAACANCSASTEQFGMLWLGKLYDKSVLKRMKKHASGSTAEQIGLLYNEYDTPFFYSIPKITRSLGATSISPKAVIKSLQDKGFKATKTQFDMSGIKTNAGIAEIRSAVMAQ